MTGKDLWYRPKLIEVALPLDDINRASVREKSIRHGNPSTLHLWWARRPLATCRAVLFAQLVDDPSAHPDKFPTEEEQKAERDRLHRIISRLVVWENIHDEELLREAHEEILKSTGGNPPPILDPFAGGGSIPLEAQRLGLEAHASDLNPVAVLINKALIEIPPKWANRPPVFPGAASEQLSWPGATGLAEDVRCYGMWIRSKADRRIGHLYPKVNASGVDTPVIAWLWARTVICPNPACSGTLPLVRSFWLARKQRAERYVRPILEGKRVRFEIGGPDGMPREGTVGRAGAECLMCGTPVPLSYIRDEGKAGRMGAQLMAIAAEGARQRYYIAPDEEHEKAADVTRPVDVPEALLPEQALGFRVQAYGMRSWADLFTNRQLTALTTFSDLIKEAAEQATKDAHFSGFSEQESSSYGASVATYLSFALSRIADRNNTICTWDSGPTSSRSSTGGSARTTTVRNAFARQALPMTWDYAEASPFSSSGGSIESALTWLVPAIAELPVSTGAIVRQGDAASPSMVEQMTVVSTDPPYYDNISYADLSDFFYVWLRRTLATIYPTILGTLLTPKSNELIADPHRNNGKEKARQFFEEGFTEVFRNIWNTSPRDYPITVFYAFKQAEEGHDGSHVSTGWETLLEGMLSAGWTVTGTWPVRTELVSRPVSLQTNALASSIVLACRPRPADAGFTDRRGLINALREEFPDALRKLEQGKVAPVDLRQAAIGPGMAVFSRYARVNEPDGSPMRVQAALALINQVLDEKLEGTTTHVSPDTRFCVEWFKQYGFDQGPFGTAETLSKGTDTSIVGLVRAGVVKSAAGKVKLLSVQDIPAFYDPEADDRTSEWEICLHLAKALQDRGTDDAARLMAAARRLPAIDVDDVKELAYLLYSIAEKKGWAETALLFNNLGTSWTDLEKLAQTAGTVAGGQGEFMLDFGSDDDGDE
jgi:putative DNA methylase